MPNLDGLQTLERIRLTHPRLPVIMFSTLTSSGALATLDALARGASDYVTKPANVGSVTAAMEHVRELLLPKIKGLARPQQVFGRSIPLAQQLPSALPSPATIRPAIIAVGVSTGGPNALAELLPVLPKSFPLPIVIVQHMPPLFTKHLAERLNAISQLNVVEALSGEVLEPGRVLIAPGGLHLLIERTKAGASVVLTETAPENSCRPSVDVLFRSVASTFGPAGVGCVLTGMGQDGLRGAAAIRRSGGRVLAQDQATSVVWGMPGSVVEANLATKILPLNEMAGELQRMLVCSARPRQLDEVSV
jgi:two-component system chemotaxis response regulator CheB